MVQSASVDQQPRDSRELKAAWRGARWWQRLHGVDPNQYGKRLAREVVFCGLTAVMVGSVLLATGKVDVLAALIAVLGIATARYGVARLRKMRR
jgi:hypothetical protein